MAAPNKSRQSADALGALAEGTFSAVPAENPFTPKPVRKPARPAVQALHDEEAVGAVGDNQGIVEMTVDDDPSAGNNLDNLNSAPAPKQRSAAYIKAKSNKAYAENFKRTIMPIMVVVGVLLAIFSIVTASMMGGDQDENGPTLFQKYGALMLVGSIPISLIMFGGVVIFYLDIRKARQMQLAKQAKSRRGR